MAALRWGRSVALAVCPVRRLATLAHLSVQAEGAAPTRTAVVLHGILGNKGNLRNFSRSLVKADASWRVVLLDHRGHGDSASLEPPHTLEACASDCLSTLESVGALGSVSLIIGHSFGGKVALEVTRRLCDSGSHRGALHTWVLDSLPGPFTEDAKSSESVASVMARLSNVVVPVPSKEHLVDDLVARGLSPLLARWMTTNLRSCADGTYTWKFDLSTATALFRAYKPADYMPVLSQLPRDVAVHFIMARRNAQWTPAMVAALADAGRAARQAGGGLVSSHWVDAGHWVHIDAPQEVLALVKERSLDVL